MNPRPSDLLATLLSALCLWLGLSAAGCATGAKTGSRAHSPLLLISLDGLRPDFYRAASGWEAPHLQALAARGASAETAEPIFPSLTYPSHSSIVTGVTSARHGVHSNMIFTLKEGASSLWYWNADALQAPTVWQRAKAAGYRTAILTWPVTVGGQSDWSIPEIFPSPPGMPGTTWELMQKSMSPALAAELLEVNHGQIPDGFEPRDRWVTAAAEHLLKKSDGPEFTMVHIISVDHAMHEHGKDSPEARQALKEADDQIGRIVDAANLSRATLILVGDHGFYDYDKVVRPNVLFARQGWLHEQKEKNAPNGRVSLRDDWKAIVHQEGGAASVYVRDPKLANRVIKLLKKNAAGSYRIIDRAELDRLGAFPGALCALNPTLGTAETPGYSISADAHGDFIEKLPKIKGNHGPLPDDPRLMSGLIAVGPGIAPGSQLGHVLLIDVAPTIAQLIDVPLSDTDGKAIDLRKPASLSAPATSR